MLISQTSIVKNKLGFLLMVLSVFPSVHANEYSNRQLAMGDLGSIKTDFVPSANDSAQRMPEQQPTWNQLSDDQKKILSALGGEWDTLRPWQREKMLDIARDYPNMDSQKQLRIQRRLIAWSRMTPYERENARKRYQQFQQLSPEKKDELRKKWAEHKKSRTETGDMEEPVFNDAE